MIKVGIGLCSTFKSSKTSNGSCCLNSSKYFFLGKPVIPISFLLRSFGLIIVNLFAYRSTDISKLYLVNDPIGPENDLHIMRLCDEAAEIICAWGNDGSYRDRGTKVMSYLKNTKCLVKLKSGRPGHPLYKSKALNPIPFELI